MGNYFIYFLLIINIIVYILAKQTKEEYTNKYFISGFGMPIVDFVVDTHDTPDIASDIKQNLQYQMTNSVAFSRILNTLITSKLVSKTIGGSALSTIRLSNHILKIFGEDKKNNFYLGCIGDDINGENIKTTLSNEQWDNDLTISNLGTSTVIVLINDNKDRETYANLGSSSMWTRSSFEKNYEKFRNSRIIYTDLYWVNHWFSSYQYLFETFSRYDDVFLGWSWAAWEILKDYPDKVKHIWPFIDIMFMNEQEFIALIKLYGYDQRYSLDDFGGLKDVFTMISEGKSNKNKNMIYIVTQGKKNTILFYRNYKEGIIEIIEEPIITIDLKLEIDYNGAGDSFAGGFLAGIIMGMNYRECGILGNIMASKVIQLKGFQIPVITKEEVRKVIYERTGSKEEL